MANPHPKPTALRILEGNPSKRPINKNEPKPKQGTSAPASLGKEAKTEWRRVYKELSNLGIVTKLDRGILATMCIAWGEIVQMNKRINKDGMLLTGVNDHGDTVIRRHPAVMVRKEAMVQYVKSAGELGCTPSARTRLSVMPKPKEKKQDVFTPGKPVKGKFGK